jgi:hypothetical protein
LGANRIPEIKHGGYRRNLAKFATEAMRAHCDWPWWVDFPTSA